MSNQNGKHMLPWSLCDIDTKSDSIYEELCLSGKRYLSEASA